MEQNIDLDVQIDPDELDIEWLEFANNYYRYSEAAIRQQTKIKVAERTFDQYKAQTDKDIRAGAKEKGEKITEAAIANLILLDEGYDEAHDAWLEAKALWEQAQNKAKSMDRKKSSLENLVKLMSMDYFSSPIDPRILTKESIKERKQQRVKKKIRNRIKK